MVRDILTIPQQVLSPPAELIECVKVRFPGATQHTCKDDRRSLIFLLAPRAGSSRPRAQARGPAVAGSLQSGLRTTAS